MLAGRPLSTTTRPPWTQPAVFGSSRRSSAQTGRRPPPPTNRTRSSAIARPLEPRPVRPPRPPVPRDARRREHGGRVRPVSPAPSRITTVDGVFAGLEPTQVQLFSIPLAWFIASFLAMSAIAHFLAGWPLRARYEAWLARGMNPLRWVEYAFSSTVMIVAIAYISFIQDVPALLAIAGCNVAMILFGWSMEAANEGRRDDPDWKHFIFGSIVGDRAVDRDRLDPARLRPPAGPARGRRHPRLRLRDRRHAVRLLQRLRRSRWSSSTGGSAAGVTTSPARRRTWS